jgi:hypothetical protein
MGALSFSDGFEYRVLDMIDPSKKGTGRPRNIPESFPQLITGVQELTTKIIRVLH